MKPIGIFYATRQGQTQHIAEHIGARLEGRGFVCEVTNVRGLARPLDFGKYSAALVAASVHAGTHEREMVSFVRRYRRELEALPNAFFSVTLSEAGVEQLERTPAERAQFAQGVETVIREFIEGTGWRPCAVKPVAGALRYSKYNPVLRFAMRQIAKQAGAPTDRDREYTDWGALDRFLEEWAATLAEPASSARATGR